MAAPRLCRPGAAPAARPASLRAPPRPRPGSSHWPAPPGPALGPAPPRVAASRQPRASARAGAVPPCAARRQGAPRRATPRVAGREGAEGPGGPWGLAPLRASPELFPSPQRLPRVSSSARVPLTGICSLRWVCSPQPSARALRSPGRTGSLRTPLRTKHKAVPQPLPSVLPRPKMLKHPTCTCPDQTEHVDSDRLEYPPSLLIKTDPAYPLSRTSGFSHLVGPKPLINPPLSAST